MPYMMENKSLVWKPPTSHYKTHHKAITNCKTGINPHLGLKPYINHYIYKPLYKIHHIPSILSTLFPGPGATTSAPCVPAPPPTAARWGHRWPRRGRPRRGRRTGNARRCDASPGGLFKGDVRGYGWDKYCGLYMYNVYIYILCIYWYCIYI